MYFSSYICSIFSSQTTLTVLCIYFRDIQLIVIPDFLYHLTNVFTNCSMNIDQLVFKLLEVTLVLVRKSFKVPIVEK